MESSMGDFPDNTYINVDLQEVKAIRDMLSQAIAEQE
jgi:hypothetical protein